MFLGFWSTRSKVGPSNLKKNDRAQFIEKIDFGGRGQGVRGGEGGGLWAKRDKNKPKMRFSYLPAVFIKNWLYKFSVNVALKLNLFKKTLFWGFWIKRTKRCPNHVFIFLWKFSCGTACRNVMIF